MKTYLLLFAGLLVSPLFAAVGSSDLQEIRRLVEERKYEEALNRHLWFHEESKTSPGMGGVRLSFALSQWAELGKAYPPALQAMREIRDQDAAKLLDGTGSFQEFHDFSAFNRTLDEQDRTYELFLQLDAKRPEIAWRCFDVSADLIVSHKNYALFMKYAGNPMARYEQYEQRRETNVELAKKNPRMDTASFRTFTDRTFTEKTVQLIDVLAKSNRLDDARAVQKRALAYFPNSAIEGSLK